jgi:hypothetical protein
MSQIFFKKEEINKQQQKEIKKGKKNPQISSFPTFAFHKNKDDHLSRPVDHNHNFPSAWILPLAGGLEKKWERQRSQTQGIYSAMVPGGGATSSWLWVGSEAGCAGRCCQEALQLTQQILA